MHALCSGVSESGSAWAFGCYSYIALATWKSPKMQSFGIKIERIDRDLLCIYETNAKWASVHICSVKWAEAKGDLDLRFKVVLWSTLT